ncbi:MAG: cache domain-containing protein, partial [Gammaproteobacteria bacterium]|nr:cache domain-containing protein [Gammaproteobacteria bacterium]
LLNDNVGLIERLRDVVFPVSEGAPRVDGVTALFLAGRQVATSLQYPDDPDAVRVLAAKSIVDRVVNHGHTVIVCMSMAGKRYIAAHAPLHGGPGERVGMLLAALPAAAHRQEQVLLLLTLLGLISIGAGGVRAMLCAQRRRLDGEMQNLARLARDGLDKVPESGFEHAIAEPGASQPVPAEAGQEGLRAALQALIERSTDQADVLRRTLTDKMAIEQELEAKRIGMETMLGHLSAVRDAVREESASKSRFIQDTCTDLTPLVGCLFDNARQLESADQSAEQHMRLESLMRNSRRLSGIVDDISAFARLSAETASDEMQAFDFDDLLRCVATRIEERARIGGIQIRRWVDPRLRDRAACGDVARIYQILLEFCSDVIVSNQSGGLSLAASLDGDTTQRITVRFEVADQDIEARDLHRRTGIESRPTARGAAGVGRSPDEDAGTGLGMSRRLTQHLNGRMGVQRLDETGCIAWCTLEFDCNLATQMAQAGNDTSTGHVRATQTTASTIRQSTSGRQLETARGAAPGN